MPDTVIDMIEEWANKLQIPAHKAYIVEGWVSKIRNLFEGHRW